MTALIEQLHLQSPVGKAMIGLLPHLSPPVILNPGPNRLLPQGCLHLPSMKLVLAGAEDLVDSALMAAEQIARAMKADVLVVSIRPNHPINAIRFDTISWKAAGPSSFRTCCSGPCPSACRPSCQGQPARLP